MEILSEIEEQNDIQCQIPPAASAPCCAESLSSLAALPIASLMSYAGHQGPKRSATAPIHC